MSHSTTNYNCERIGGHERRVANIPSIIQNKAFSDEVLDLLQVTHEKVKMSLREAAKKGTPKLSNQAIVNKPTKDVSRAFMKSPLFDAIDIHLFDNNVKYYDQGICPSCNSQLVKRPVKKGKCGSCDSMLFVKASVFNGQKLLMTELEYEHMVKIRKERSYRNWVNNMLAKTGNDITNFPRQIEREGISIEQGLIASITKSSEEHYKNCNLGLYRNSLMYLGNVYERMNNLEDALIMYLSVCYYDLRGHTNGSKDFNKEYALLAPAIVQGVKKLGDNLSLNRERIKDYYEVAVRQLIGISKPFQIAETWKELEDKLYNEIIDI